MTGEKGTERPQAGSLTKRRFLTGAVTAVAATTGATTLGAFTAIAAPVVGPIEAAWREFNARCADLDTVDDDVFEAKSEWLWTPLYKAASLNPGDSPREWAALMLVALYVHTSYEPELAPKVLRTVEDLLGADAQVEKTRI